MPKIEWSDALSVKINTFDNEHKKLVDILNRLYDAMSQGQGHKVMADLLIELNNFTKIHFSHEEDIMKKYNYSGFPEQKKAHEEFVSKINETQTQYDSGAISLSLPIFNFLISWIQNHIQKMDRGYSEFLIKQGVK